MPITMSMHAASLVATACPPMSTARVGTLSLENALHRAPTFCAAGLCHTMNLRAQPLEEAARMIKCAPRAQSCRASAHSSLQGSSAVSQVKTYAKYNFYWILLG